MALLSAKLVQCTLSSLGTKAVLKRHESFRRGSLQARCVHLNHSRPLLSARPRIKGANGLTTVRSRRDQPESLRASRSHNEADVSCDKIVDKHTFSLAVELEEGEAQKEQAFLPALLQLVRRVLPLLSVASFVYLALRPAAALAHAVAIPAHAGEGGIANQLLVSAWTGLVAGCLHTLTGPDHLAALAPLAIGRTRMEAASIGALWGCGHDAGQVLFGVLFVLLKDRLHLDLLRKWGTRVVGVTLLAIGALGINEARNLPPIEEAAAGARDPPRGGGGDEEGGAAVGEDTEMEVLPDGTLALKRPGGGSAGAGGRGGGSKRAFGVATFVTGIVHGLQPDALLIILPALALPSKAAGAAFLAMFLLGTVVAMGSYTAFIGSCSEALQEKIPGFTQRLSWFAALLAIALGALILLGEVFGFALF